MFIESIKTTTLACCLLLSGGCLCAQATVVKTQVAVAATPLLNVTQKAQIGGQEDVALDKKVTVKPGDYVNFVTQITNTGTAPATDALFFVTLPEGLSCYGGVTVNGVTVPSYSSGQTFVAHGFNIPVTSSSCPALEVRYGVTVDAPPPDGITKMKSVAQLFFISYPEAGPVEGATTVAKSNPVNVVFNQPISTPYPVLNLTQTVTNSAGETKKRLKVSPGDLLTFTVNVKNVGDVESEFSGFNTLLPDGLSYVPDSFLVNGKPASNLVNSVQSTGKTLLAATIPVAAKGEPGDHGVLCFKVKVNSPPPSGVTSYTSYGMVAYMGNPNVEGSVASSNNVVLILK